MGAFLVNFHVQTDAAEPVADALQNFPVEQAWMTETQSGWVSFWEAEASQQNTDRIQSLAEHVSRSLQVPVISFLDHDSDILCYWLYDQGELRDEFNSCPNYWGGEFIEEEPFEADCNLFIQYCRPDTEVSQLESALQQSKMADLQRGELPKFVFAEERFSLLAPLLGIPEEILTTDYSDIGRDVKPEEVNAQWIGAGEPPEAGASPFDDMNDYEAMMPQSPLYAAAQSDDIDEIEKLVNEGAEINEIPHGYAVTALGIAASQGTPETLRRLVALGADLHKSGQEGASPIRLAVSSTRTDNIRTLIELGADLQEHHPQFGTLLHQATMFGSPEVIRLLLEQGVDPQITNAAGMTALQTVEMQLDGLQQIQDQVPAQAAEPFKQQLQTLEEVARALRQASD